MIPAGLTKPQRHALGLLMRAEKTSGEWCGAISGVATAVIDGQPCIHYRTVIALWRRGLIEIEDWDRTLDLDEQPESDGLIRLTAASTEGGEQ